MNIQLSWLAIVFLLSCQPSQNPPKVVQLTGQAQGTTYAITYHGAEVVNYQMEVDSIFDVINRSMSTYHKGSTILQFNDADVSFESNDANFLAVLEQAESIYEFSDGAFDPTVMPLVKAWGFGPDNRLEPKVENLDSLMQYVGFDKIEYAVSSAAEDGFLVKKLQSGVELDFNAIAQGYTVDVIAQFLDAKEIEDYLIEIGGEVISKGNNPDGNLWRIGIEKPDETQIIGLQNFAAIIQLDNASIASSGNYRKFYLKDGIKYSHTIDPKTAQPVQHSLLSVTIMTDKASKADAFATAFMVMGLEKSKRFIETHPELNIEAYFISDGEGQKYAVYVTSGMKEQMVEEK